MPRHRKQALQPTPAPAELEPAPFNADWVMPEDKECPWCNERHPYDFDTNQCPTRLERVRQMYQTTPQPSGSLEPAPFLTDEEAPRQVTAWRNYTPLNDLMDAHPNVSWNPNEADNHISFGTIKVDPSQQQQGYGTAALQDLNTYADQVQKPIVITPTNEFGTPRTVLDRWYKGLGYQNRPKSEFELPMGTMVRYPQGRTANILDPVAKTLDPKVWIHPEAPDPQFHPKLNEWLHKVIYGALERNGYEGPQRWLKLVLTGSLTTYQYSPTSDCDVSLFVHGLPEWSRGEMIGVMVKEFDGILLPGTSHDIQAFVVSKLLTPQDLYKPGLRSAYDLEANKWIVPPDHSMAHDTNHEYPAEMAYGYEVCDKMDRLLKYEPDKAVQFYNVLHRRRQREQTAGKGDFAQSNIAYKMLMNRGYGDRLRDLGVKIY